MKTMLAALAGIGLCASLASAQTATTTTPAAPDQPTIHQRLENQNDRIQAGTADGQLTNGERRRLRADDAGVRAQAQAERKADGGKLTAGQKQQINQELNQDSRKIYRARHNNRTPKS